MGGMIGSHVVLDDGENFGGGGGLGNQKLKLMIMVPYFQTGSF